MDIPMAIPDVAVPDAAAVAAAAASEIAVSMRLEEIPVKLRCAGCNKLAMNAFRMPCCDQCVCETCQESLDDCCPICLHEPIQKQDCKPNKSLRTTIRAFLKKKVMEKENARKKQMLAKKPPPSAAPASLETANGEASQLNSVIEAGSTLVPVAKDSPGETPQASSAAPVQILEGDGQQTPSDGQKDIPRPSIESNGENAQGENTNDEKSQAASAGGEQDGGEGVQPSKGIDQQVQNGGNQNMNGLWPLNGGLGQGMIGGAFGLEGMNGVFPSMGLNGTTDFSQMMQFMPNSMPNAMMGAFPNMMGMPGMGMDPMAMSQAMYGGFGGPSMGMNGMNGINMGIGFNNGQGAFGGFNGQTDAWNNGQNNFNPNAYGNIANGMSGNFGAQTGYAGHNMPSHQGNFNQMNHQQFPNNDFQNGYNGQGFQNRGRGRRGGYNNVGRGRGGYYQAAQGNHASQGNHESFHHQLPSQATPQNTAQVSTGQQLEKPGTDYDPAKELSQNLLLETSVADKTGEEQMSKELNPGDEGDKSQAELVTGIETIAEASEKADTDQQPLNKDPEQGLALADEKPEVTLKVEESKPVAIQTYISSEEDSIQKPFSEIVPKLETNSMPPPSPAIPLGPAALYYRDNPFDSGRSRGSGRGYYGGAPDLRGGYRGRSAAYLANGHAIHTSPTQISPINTQPQFVLAEPKGQGVEGAPKGPKALREGLPNTGIRGGRGFSIVGRAAAAVHPKSNGSTRSRSRSPSRHRSRSRSPLSSHHRSSHHRSHRHRSKSVSDNDERERRRERHSRRSRKYEDEGRNGVDAPEDREESRKRDPSLESTSRRSHRGHRSHDYENPSSSHRHHRDRSRDRDEERRYRRKRSKSPTSNSIVPTPTSTEAAPTSPSGNRHYDKEDSRDSRKRRDRDDEDHHHDRKRSRRDRSATPEVKDHRIKRDRSNTEKHTVNPSNSNSTFVSRPPTGPSKDYRNGEQSNISSSKPATITKPKSQPEKDHHTLEREARNKERLMKELQRREAMEGKGPKRRGSGIDGKGGAGIGRRVSYKYEDEESEEARASRVESEREGGRWER